MKVRRKTLQAILPAASKDDTRFNLCGALVKPDGTFVATDGHRLHMVKQAHEETHWAGWASAPSELAGTHRTCGSQSSSSCWTRRAPHRSTRCGPRR